MDLIISDPVQNCRIKMGVFSFTLPNGQHDTADFFILCEDSPNCAEVYARRMDAYNEQFTEGWERLESEGYTNISYLEEVPFPLY